MFHFPGFASRPELRDGFSTFKSREFPHSDITGSKVARHLPGAYRSQATSFIAFRNQGIHHTPFFMFSVRKCTFTRLNFCKKFWRASPKKFAKQVSSDLPDYNPPKLLTKFLRTRLSKSRRSVNSDASVGVPTSLIYFKSASGLKNPPSGGPVLRHITSGSTPPAH